LGDDPTDDSQDSDKEKTEKSASSKQNEPFLKNVFDSDKSGFAPFTAPNTFADILGTPKTETSAEDFQKQKTHSRELQQMYGNPFGAFNASGDAPTRSLAPVGSLSPNGSLEPFGSPVARGTTLPTFNSGGLPDLSPKGFALSPSTPPLQPKIEPPKLTPAAPSFTAPKRPF
jgi:hypothetical protein